MEADLKARIIAEHKERYIILTDSGPVPAEITGNLRYTATSREDFPAVGDWVTYQMMDDYSAILFSILPRKTLLLRRAVGKIGETQVIASNIDQAFIVQSVGYDFNLNRFERYLTLCYAAGIDPVIILTKTDLLAPAEIDSYYEQVKGRVKQVEVLAVSSQTGEGMNELKGCLESGKTYCFLGSSGVGKSTLINTMLEESKMKTREISVSTAKGKHTTSHRELIMLPNGSAVIDTPGMREIGMIDEKQGIAETFNDIDKLAADCKYQDCTHLGERGCAVEAAVQEGHLPQEVLDHYHKLKREQEHYSSTVYEKRQRDREFGKMVNTILKNKAKKF